MPTAGLRRVTGLRREEVAVLGAVSADYYTRLEQGREEHPSAAVLDSLSAALLLDADARQHLYRLAGSAPAPTPATVEPIAPDLLALLCELESSPALILTDRLDVLARNPLAEMLHAGFASADNTARMVFADPTGRSFYQPWDDAATTAVATLQTAAGLDPGDERLCALVAELAGDIVFTKLWSRQIVRTKTAEVKHFQHPRRGHYDLHTGHST